ncbi:MAG: PepSY-like domain-containing protein [Muribaculum sp.]|nr:PepSY-like domain-containing protein [Muribaculum sp.]
MKKTLLTSLLIGIAAIAASSMANAQQKVVPDKPIRIGSVGPAMSESVKMIPINGIRFIVEYYPDDGIVSMEKELASNTYDVKLTNGTEIEFNSKGNVIEIDAADNSTIPLDVLQAVLPANTYQALQNDGIASNVESIEMTKGGYQIETNIPEDVEYFYAIEEIITPA